VRLLADLSGVSGTAGAVVSHMILEVEWIQSRDSGSRGPLVDCLRASPTPADPATIGRSLQIKGEVIGSESLYIDGKVEGAITLPGSRVTVSRDAQVSANITAREVMIFGKVSGNIIASDRVDIRSEGSVARDVTAQRITIGDGSFFRGGIDISKPGQQKDRIAGAEISANASQTAA
jgi:cytoskeletal protein CcmA (bactofilin family)